MCAPNLGLAIFANSKMLMEYGMLFEKYIPEEPKNQAYDALFRMMADFDRDKSYADMIRYRLSGAAAEECHDVYYVAHENGQAVCRHWNGWGKHPDAIGNWGNFYTDPQFRGKGIGGALLRFWFEDYQSASDLPLCFLCSAGTKELTNLYGRFGFRVAIEGTEYGFLYKPVGNSPETFREFHRGYYKPSPVLYHRRASVGYRHEIDCLLKFTFKDLGLSFGNGVESALLYTPERCGMLFSEDGHCVGWSYDGAIQVHPLYADATVVDERTQRRESF